MQDSKKIFCSPEKNQSQETFYNSIPDALHNLHTSNAKYLPIDLMMLAYENRQNATKFARANNSDLLRPLKLFISTRVHFIYAIANILLHIHLLQSTLHCTSITINPSLHIYYSQPFTTHLLQSILHYTSITIFYYTSTVNLLFSIYNSQLFILQGNLSKQSYWGPDINSRVVVTKKITGLFVCSFMCNQLFWVIF